MDSSFISAAIEAVSYTHLIDKIRGLGLGADDYIEKPFSPGVLVARVKAHLARYARLTQPSAAPAEITLGGVAVNTASRRVTVEGKETELKRCV